MCPHCRQNAPVIYRGIVAYCTACGAVRPPLTGSSLNLAGKGSRVGGTVAKVFGWLVLGIGGTVGLILLALLQWIFPEGIAGLLVGLPVLVLSAIVSTLLLLSGR